MYPYRVFISYSHDDVAIAAQVRARLEEVGAVPMSDVDIVGGTRFGDEIRRQISFAHAFVPILTANSKSRPWVHQEIGYAIGLSVPVLPLALDELPAGMADEIQAVRVKPDLSDLPQKLTSAALEHSVTQSQEAATAAFEFAGRIYQRTAKFNTYARALLKRPGPQRIRQRAAFSSFSIPSRGVRDPAWNEREGEERLGDEVREVLRQERDLMERHAREAGCDLILDPTVMHEKPRDAAAPPVPLPPGTRARIGVLRDFLASMPPEKLRVVLHKGRVHDSMMAIGDWVVAEAVVPHYKLGGYQKTAFTRHAPTVLSRIEEFDRDLTEALADADLSPQESRDAAVATLTGMLTAPA